MVLRKKEVYTVVTPIPGFIPRQLAIDILHSHSETITLNPLVLSHKQIKAPRDAAADEYFSTWYEITERVQYIPGLGRLGSGVISFNGCFHDLPWGLQTHIYAPANVDLRVKYRIGGNQPGVEPPEQPEIGLAALGAPSDGLYLREDIEIKCNIAMVGLVKSQMKAASKEMVARIMKKAELLDSGALQAMIEDGKIKTVNPRDRLYTGGGQSNSATSPPSSPFQQPPLSPSIPYQVPRPMSLPQQQGGSRPGTAGSQQYSAHLRKTSQHANELSHGSPLQQQPPAIVMELPGDYYHAAPHLQPPPSGSAVHPARDRASTAASMQSRSSDQNSSGWRWSGGAGGGAGGGGQGSPSLNSSRPTSYSSDGGSGGGGFASPSLDPKGFASDLPTHRETQEEHGNPRTTTGYRPYNPADYARIAR